MILSITLLITTACSNEAETSADGDSAEDKPSIYTTVFALESLTEQIVGDFADVESVYPDGTDVHTFEPTQQDMIDYAESDLFITTNNELDAVSKKITDALDGEAETLEAVEETGELIAHSHDHGHEEDSHNHGTLDPHVWLDPVIAADMVESIEQKLSGKYPDNAEIFQENAEVLKGELTSLDDSLEEVTEEKMVDSVYISHESIGYLSERYDFHQIGVSGLNNEEPSQQELINMLESIGSDGAKYLLLEQNIASSVTDVVQKQADLESLRFHNLAVLTDGDDPEATYQSLMEANIEVLDQALNGYKDEEAAALEENVHDEAHNHDHGHDEDIYNGYFEDQQVEDRALSDWAGDWQSVYPYLEDGSLDEVFEHKAVEGEMTAEEYKEYYDTGYRTDVERIEIKGKEVTFHQGGESHMGEYVSDGYEILEYEDGNRGVRFIFKLEDAAADGGSLPNYIQFSDHNIFPVESDHFHIYTGDDREALLEEMEHWPTYYPSSLSGDEIAEEMMAH